MPETMLIFLFLVSYMVPTYIAFKRNHKNRIPILVLNLLLGWSFIMWLICLVWSVTDIDYE